MHIEGFHACCFVYWKNTSGIHQSVQNLEILMVLSVVSAAKHHFTHPNLISGHQLGLQGLTVRGDVRLGRTSRRTCLWWGCRWGTRTSRTSRGRCRRERPERRTDPGRSAERRRFGLAFGTYRNGRSWWVKKQQQQNNSDIITSLRERSLFCIKPLKSWKWWREWKHCI